MLPDLVQGQTIYEKRCILAATRLISMHVNKGRNKAQCLQARINYAANPSKTENGELVTSYECDPKTAAEDSTFRGLGMCPNKQKFAFVAQKPCLPVVSGIPDNQFVEIPFIEDDVDLC